MSKIMKIGKGVGFPPHMLKDAVFVKAAAAGSIYCYIDTRDDVRHAFTRHQVFRLSNRGGKYVARLREFLKDQGDWNEGIWKEPEGETWPSEEEMQEARRFMKETLKEQGKKPSED